MVRHIKKKKQKNYEKGYAEYLMSVGPDDLRFVIIEVMGLLGTDEMSSAGNYIIAIRPDLKDEVKRVIKNKTRTYTRRRRND